MQWPEEDDEGVEVPATQQQGPTSELGRNFSQNPFPASQWPRNGAGRRLAIPRKASLATSLSIDSVEPATQVSVSDPGSQPDMVASSQVSQATAGPGPSTQAAKKRKRSLGVSKSKKLIGEFDDDEDEYMPKEKPTSKRARKRVVKI